MGGAECDGLNNDGDSRFLLSPSDTQRPCHPLPPNCLWKGHRGSRPAAFKTKTNRCPSDLTWRHVLDVTPGPFFVFFCAIVLTPSIIHSGIREVIRKSSPATQNRLLLSVSWILICSPLRCQVKCWMLAPVAGFKPTHNPSKTDNCTI